MSRAKKTEADQKLMDEWLKSNEVTVCPAHARTEQEDIVYTFKVGNRGRKPAPIVTKSPWDIVTKSPHDKS
tara:strand:+ start:320 stop:532 length:213 start_codon:yes stop_codon:yes gene_type:complete